MKRDREKLKEVRQAAQAFEIAFGADPEGQDAVRYVAAQICLAEDGPCACCLKRAKEFLKYRTKRIEESRARRRAYEARRQKARAKGGE